MSKIEKKIIAIGGVGVTPESDESLDHFILNQLKKIKNNIGFLGTASKDDNEKVEKFYKKFDNSNSELSHFNLTSSVNGFSDWLLSKDLVYVGGGNTSFMLEIWRKNNFEQVFKIAYEKGTILSGVSAGAVCWFDWILSDSMGQGFKPLKGISILEGSCTPHSSNIERINEFEMNIKNNKLPKGIAIDDGVAVVFIDGKPTEVYSTVNNQSAYFLDKNKKINLKEYIKNK
ncbi:peptidase E [Candidatus Pelagibacter sp. HTCC7211]|uniref:Type 1 glutamine amidotransferase-like domain-containing protein n=1 Tax=Pelagibacter sp. (strain HTCC7211) TaxID=439493 RepID=UPI000183BAAC|nr:Type 1 glutamine amidotransferase-like domain-containing protein [Candidatus Pelagibacter sp. HTCC7211]EDZ59795.1 peptidase E [Candidatus Pelagibacter sp. HTCC7211]